TMTGLSLILQAALACVLILLALLSLQLLGLCLIRRLLPARSVKFGHLPEEALPHVLVQLPVRDEGNLALRVAQAAAQLDWPRDRLEIQLLDDGRPGSHEGLCNGIRNTIPED